MSGTSCCGAMAGSCFCNHGPPVAITVVKVPSLLACMHGALSLVLRGLITQQEAFELANIRYRQARAAYMREEIEKRIGWYGSIADRYA